MRNTGSRTRPMHTRVGKRTPKQKAAFRMSQNKKFAEAVAKSRREMAKGWDTYGPKQWRAETRRIAKMNKDAIQSVKRQQRLDGKGRPPKYFWGLGILALLGLYAANQGDVSFQSVRSAVAAGGQRVTGFYQ